MAHKGAQRQADSFDVPQRVFADNAACEGFFGRLKTELFYPRKWEEITIKGFMKIVDTYIRWYNEKRVKISLGSLSPIEYREGLGFAA
jgi:putative transposase